MFNVGFNLLWTLKLFYPSEGNSGFDIDKDHDHDEEEDFDGGVKDDNEAKYLIEFVEVERPH